MIKKTVSADELPFVVHCYKSSVISRKAVEREKLKTEAEKSISTKYNYRETIAAFILKTYLKMRRKK